MQPDKHTFAFEIQFRIMPVGKIKWLRIFHYIIIMIIGIRHSNISRHVQLQVQRKLHWPGIIFKKNDIVINSQTAYFKFSIFDDQLLRQISQSQQLNLDLFNQCCFTA